MPTTHETEKTEKSLLIGHGPNMQARADQIGGLLTSAVDKQTVATAELLRLYRQYLAECKDSGLTPKPLAEVPCRDC